MTLVQNPVARMLTSPSYYTHYFLDVHVLTASQAWSPPTSLGTCGESKVVVLVLVLVPHIQRIGCQPEKGESNREKGNVQSEYFSVSKKYNIRC